jgi:RNA polymerase sigma factor (sigma-70 family)
MSSDSRSSLLRQFRTLFEAGTVAGLTDGQLLERFLAGHDEGGEVAFAALVARHGPMVLGVCRRALPDPNDAADAYQATFLILVRKARSVRVDDSLGRWLYGVSRRVASRARATAARRPRAEAGEIEAIEARSTDPDRFELAGLLDEELARLPESFRSALVLCDLEGLTHEEAARDLRCPVGTIKSRLARGRERLRGRLTRRGLAPSSLMVAPVVPATLVESVVQASMLSVGSGKSAVGMVSASAVALAEGVLKSMNGITLKLTASAVLTVGVVASGASLLAQGQKGEAKSADTQASKTVEPVRDRTGREPTDGFFDTPEAKAVKPVKDRDEEARIADRMEAKLGGLVTVNFKEYPLEKAAQDLSTYTGANIVIDKKRLAEAGVSPDSPVTLMAKEITLRSVLKYLLSPLQLSYQVVDDVLLITTAVTTQGQKLSELLRDLQLTRKRLAKTERIARDPQDPSILRARKHVAELESAVAQIDKTLSTVLGIAPEPPANPGRKPWPGRGEGVEPPREGKMVSMPDYVIDPPDIIVIEFLEALPGGPITGERLVRPDGKISLGFYGEVYVAGLTTTEAKAKIALHLREFIQERVLGLTRFNPETGKDEPVEPSRTNQIFVDVAAYNSKVYYVQGEVITPGRLAATGNETVLDAINFAGGLTPRAAKDRIRLVRPAQGGSESELTLLVNLPAIIDQGQSKTNYQLLPGDRLIVDRDPNVALEEAKVPKSEKAAATSDVEARLQSVERKLDEVLKALERLPKP